MMDFNEKFWIKLSVLSLLIVAFFGALMRYKIGFEFPYFNQKNLQHAHSHFAFSGWITQTIWLFLVIFIQQNISRSRLNAYVKLLAANLLCSYAMLGSFTIQGYGVVSITFSTLSIALNLWFLVFYFHDLKYVEAGHPAKNYFKVALLFNALSALGTFALSYMMATKQLSQYLYLSSVYWYLHFQYNGWFLFACFGLFLVFVKQLLPHYIHSKSIFSLFVISCVPAYGLSILWLELPFWLYSIIILAAVAQFIGWIKFLFELKLHSFIGKNNIKQLPNVLFAIIALAITIKFTLQLGSTIPVVSTLAFGFRPIVIAYLHLVFLLIVSLFLINYAVVNEYIYLNSGAKMGLLFFVFGIAMNELMLAMQGIASFSYTLIPYANEVLFSVSLLTLIGLVILLLSQYYKTENNIVKL